MITGASRGVGRGVALALAGKGFDIVVTGREKDRLDALGAEVAALGVRFEGQVCDHGDLDATVAVFERIGSDFDIIVNNAWAGYFRMVEDGQYTWEKKFWEQPLHRWTSMMDVGVRTAFFCSKHCVAGMLERRRGLIVNISFWAARQYHQNVIYGVSKAAVDKLSHDMAVELRGYGVAAVSLYPGLVRTEGVLENASFFDMSNSESPEFSGLVIEALLRDPARMDKSGNFYTSSELAREYGIRDIDGKIIADSWVRR
jgi:NAD(P)-dependent dehydrogenase (short-subunit alcohol dehydrogenase family)